MRTELPSGTAVELARPAGTPTRGLVLSPDIGGLRPLFDQLCHRLSTEHGWAVAAVEPWPGQKHLTIEERLAAVGSLDDDRLLADCESAADLLAVAPVAVLGFCMGGMVALKAAATGRFDKAVSFYGMVHLPEHWQSTTMGDPLARYRDSEVRAPVLHLSGSEDPWVTQPDLDDLASQVKRLFAVKDRTHGFPARTYPKVFVGADAVSALIRAGIAADEDHAGQLLLGDRQHELVAVCSHLE